MEKLICGTSAYKIFSADKRADRLSHAYMLYFADAANLRRALKLFALGFFGCGKDDRDGRLILSEGLADMKIYPQPDKKLTAGDAAEIVDDSVKKPVERDRKLYIVSDFGSASPIFQNKLLKILEEPPEGVYFLLGTLSLAPVLDTVRSRVKLLEIPPFTEGEIYAALERAGSNPQNAGAAKACGGILGVAQNVLHGEWYKEVRAAAEKICSVSTVGEAVDAANKYGETKYKKELLSEMQRVYFAELERYATDPCYEGGLPLKKVSFAVEAIGGALADLRFNANFQSLLFDFLLRVVNA